jgi:hypothetical protein
MASIANPIVKMTETSVAPAIAAQDGKRVMGEPNGRVHGHRADTGRIALRNG